MVRWKMAGYLKGNDPIGDTPIFNFHDYGRKGKTPFIYTSTRPSLLVGLRLATTSWIQAGMKATPTILLGDLSEISGSFCWNKWRDRKKVHGKRLKMGIFLSLPGKSWKMELLFESTWICKRSRYYYYHPYSYVIIWDTHVLQHEIDERNGRPVYWRQTASCFIPRSLILCVLAPLLLTWWLVDEVFFCLWPPKDGVTWVGICFSS